MGYLRSATSILRKAILIGWALAVLWIYLGNLVNFHQNRIWGKQLIPVACSSTRVKEKDESSLVKYDNNSKPFNSGQHFDFTTPDQLVISTPRFEVTYLFFILPDVLVLQQDIHAYSLRGPPSA
jgi:hypothetical protein